MLQAKIRDDLVPLIVTIQINNYRASHSICSRVQVKRKQIPRPRIRTELLLGPPGQVLHRFAPLHRHPRLWVFRGSPCRVDQTLLVRRER